MKSKITILALLVGSFAAHAQIQKPTTNTQDVEVQVVKDTLVVVPAIVEVEENEDEVTENWDAILYQKTERDTVVSYRKKVYPFLRYGFGNLSSDHQFAHSDLSYTKSMFFEWGFLSRIPFDKKNNTIGLLYGLSFSYEYLTPTQNNHFVLEGKETVLEPYTTDLKRKESYFKNSYINIPLALDFDFSKKTYNSEKKRFDVKNGVNFGLGGYLGYNINSKQFLSYKDDKGYRTRVMTKGSWNVNDFNYGLMAYVGYSNLKLIGKYDMQPTFKNNATDQRFWSLGLQVDFK